MLKWIRLAHDKENWEALTKKFFKISRFTGVENFLTS